MEKVSAERFSISARISSSPMRAQLHLIKSFKLDHFSFFITAFEQRHNLRSTSSSTAERQFPPRKGEGKSEGKELLASSASPSASSDGE